MKKGTGKRAAALFLAGCMMTAMMGCGEQEQEATVSDSAHVQVQSPESGSLILQNEFIGTISPEEAVYVMPLVSAEVLNLSVEVGDTVHAGDVLCQLDSEAARLQLESAQASYASAQASANSTLGGQMELQDYQTAENIRQLEKQVNDLNEDLTESRDDYTDTSNDLDDVDAWKDDAKDSFEDRSEDYYTAEALYNKLKDVQSSAGGKIFAGMSLEQAAGKAMGVVQDYQVKKGTLDAAKELLKQFEASNPAVTASDVTDVTDEISLPDSTPSKEDLEKAVEDAQKAVDEVEPEYNAAITVIGLDQAAAAKGIDSDDISQSGVSKLSSKMASAQSEYTNASTQKATLEAQKDGYDSAVEQLEDSLSSLEESLRAAKDMEEISKGRVKAETQALMDAQLNAAGVGIKSAEFQLDLYTLSAPIGGVVEAVNVSDHGFAATGNAAFVISNKDTMTASFYVSEAIRNTLQIGQSVSVDRNGTVYPATVTEINSMVDQQTGLFKIKASVEADGQTLLTGSSVKITADTYRAEDVLLLPYDAVYYENGRAYVYAVEQDAAVRKNVETGIFNDTTIAVLSGLTPQDKIITTWASNLREGVAVVVEEADTEVAP